VNWAIPIRGLVDNFGYFSPERARRVLMQQSINAASQRLGADLTAT
jgi:hypothetical protein